MSKKRFAEGKNQGEYIWTVFQDKRGRETSTSICLFPLFLLPGAALFTQIWPVLFFCWLCRFPSEESANPDLISFELEFVQSTMCADCEVTTPGLYSESASTFPPFILYALTRNHPVSGNSSGLPGNPQPWNNEAWWKSSLHPQWVTSQQWIHTWQTFVLSIGAFERVQCLQKGPPVIRPLVFKRFLVTLKHTERCYEETRR